MNTATPSREEINEAHAELAGIRDAMAAKYPAAGITFGCIGNVWEGNRDDRGWFFFTQTGTFMEQGTAATRWGNYETNQLPEMAARAKAGVFETWIQKRLGITKAERGA